MSRASERRPKGNWALVLGSSSGSGEAMARAMARDPGLNIFGIHRGNHPEQAQALADYVRQQDRRYVEYVGEAGRIDELEQAAAALEQALEGQRVHILVHAIANASLGRLAVGPGLLHPKQVLKTFEAMAHSFVFWTRHLVARDLVGSGARFLALTNAANDSTLADAAAIAAAKAALESYVRYLAWELGPQGYRVNALKYGTVETTAVDVVFDAKGWETVKSLHEAMFPAGRLASLEEIAKMVSFLASDGGAWFNGAVVDMTGGQMNSLYQLLLDRL